MRTLSRAAAFGAIAVLMALAGCSDSATSAGKTSRPASSAPPVGMKLVVEPPSKPPTVTLGAEPAAIIYLDWLSGQRVDHREPGAVVSWAIAPRPPAGQPEAITIATDVAPDHLELRTFDQLDATGTPVGQGSASPCLVQQTGVCRLAVASSVTVTITVDGAAAAIILDGQWYVPEKDRRTLSQAAAFDTVSWGFRYASRSHPSTAQSR